MKQIEITVMGNTQTYTVLNERFFADGRGINYMLLCKFEPMSGEMDFFAYAHTTPGGEMVTKYLINNENVAAFDFDDFAKRTIETVLPHTKGA